LPATPGAIGRRAGTMCDRSNRTQEENGVRLRQTAVLFRAGWSQSKAVSLIGAAAVCFPVAARALRLEGGEPTVADTAAWR
jgi:hypothetical protein